VCRFVTCSSVQLCHKHCTTPRVLTHCKYSLLLLHVFWPIANTACYYSTCSWTNANRACYCSTCSDPLQIQLATTPHVVNYCKYSLLLLHVFWPIANTVYYYSTCSDSLQIQLATTPHVLNHCKYSLLPLHMFWTIANTACYHSTCFDPLKIQLATTPHVLTHYKYSLPLLFHWNYFTLFAKVNYSLFSRVTETSV
jgi:hypothetical protein